MRRDCEVGVSPNNGLVADDDGSFAKTLVAAPRVEPDLRA